MRVSIDDFGKLSVTRRHTTRDGICYDKTTDVGLIHEPYLNVRGWEVYFYVGPNRNRRISVRDIDEAIRMLLAAVS